MATRRKPTPTTVVAGSPTCGKCTYFGKAEGGEHGTCFGNPPQVITNGANVGTFRPYVDAIDRACSQFRPTVLNA